MVPNQGWVLFGGYQSTLLTAQKLQYLSGTWKAGPNLYQSTIDSRTCGVQVWIALNSLSFCLSVYLSVFVFIGIGECRVKRKIHFFANFFQFKFQLSDTTTVILSGIVDSKRILVFDWTSMAYTLQTTKLSGDRSRASCALLKGTYGTDIEIEK